MRILILIILLFFGCSKIVDGELYFVEKQFPLGLPIPPTPVEVFMDRIAEIESDGRYDVVNRYGFLGKYQFSPTTINYMGFDVTRDDFLLNPELQDSVMITYMKHNNEYLNEYINRYDGVIVDGVYLNRATILAGAHFAGAGGMRRFLISMGKNTTVDGNGMNITNYIKHFSDINIPESVGG